MNQDRSRLRAVKDETGAEPTEGFGSGEPAVSRATVASPGTQIPDGRLPFQRLDAYVVAKEIGRRVHRMKIGDKELRDQATRAAKSTFLRLSEGLPNEGAALRRKYFTEANNSLHELLGAMDLAQAIDVVRADEAETVLCLGGRLKRMIRALLH